MLLSRPDDGQKWNTVDSLIRYVVHRKSMRRANNVKQPLSASPDEIGTLWSSLSPVLENSSNGTCGKPHFISGQTQSRRILNLFEKSMNNFRPGWYQIYLFLNNFGIILTPKVVHF